MWYVKNWEIGKKMSNIGFIDCLDLGHCRTTQLEYCSAAICLIILGWGFASLFDGKKWL